MNANSFKNQIATAQSTNALLIQSMNGQLNAYFDFYTDPMVYSDPATGHSLSASTTTCCATGTCDDICPIS